jgi:Uma2 family endonuclease
MVQARRPATYEDLLGVSEHQLAQIVDGSSSTNPSSISGPTSSFPTLAPDWVCEVLSPSTSKIVRGPKRRVHAREHVTYLWIVDPEAKALEAFRLEGDSYLLIATHEVDDKVRVPPFDAVELELAAWWSR